MLSRAYLWSTIGLLCLILSAGEALGQQELWDKHMQVAKEAFAKSEYMEAEQHVLAAIEAAKMFPPEDTRAGSSIDLLAHVYQATGRFKDAESRFEEAIEFYASRVGPAHPWTMVEINNLGGLYSALGRYSDAARLYRIAVNRLQKTLGPKHPTVALTLNNLAEIYLRQKQYFEAEALYRESLSITRQTMGSGHPKVALIMNNLAHLREPLRGWLDRFIILVLCTTKDWE
jgi:tetratricopeptide (TPR) repeat protein